MPTVTIRSWFTLAGFEFALGAMGPVWSNSYAKAELSPGEWRECLVLVISAAIQGGRPHSKPPLTTTLLDGVAAQVGLAVGVVWMADEEVAGDVFEEDGAEEVAGDVFEEDGAGDVVEENGAEDVFEEAGAEVEEDTLDDTTPTDDTVGVEDLDDEV